MLRYLKGAFVAVEQIEIHSHDRANKDPCSFRLCLCMALSRGRLRGFGLCPLGTVGASNQENRQYKKERRTKAWLVSGVIQCSE